MFTISINRGLKKLIPAVLVATFVFASCGYGGKRDNEAISSYNQGVRAVKAGNLELASYHFRRATIIKPDFQEARLNLANVYFMSDNYDAARKEYIELMYEKNYDPRLYFNLGWIYFTQGDYETSKQCFSNAQKYNPNFHDADYGLAMIAQKEGNLELAKTHFEKYMQNEPDGRWSESIKNSLALIDPSRNEAPVNQPELPSNEIQDQPPDVKPEVKEPTNPVVLPSEVKPAKQTSIVAEKPSKPKTPAPEKKKENKKTVSGLISDGNIALGKGDLKKAESCFKEASKLDEKSIDAVLGIAKVNFMKKKSSLEKESIRKAIKLRKGNPDDNYAVAQELEKIGDLKSAIEEYRNYLASNPFGGNAEKAKKRLTELDKSLGGEG